MNMEISASAPGKLVLTGEYAVLEGAPALVRAVDRRAQVRLEALPDQAIVIDAPELDVLGATARLDASGRLVLHDAGLAAGGQLALFGSVVESVAALGPLSGFHAWLDTRSFFSPESPQRKLGLGSSAAIGVALGGALHVLAGLESPSAESLIAAHRRAQGGFGSGLDIAASLAGGLISYVWREGQPQVTPAGWPPGLEFCCVWSGRSASTGVFLRGLADWRARAPARYAAVMGDLAGCAQVAVSALREHRTDALIEAIDAYAAGLARLGAASGLDIMSAEHRALRAVAADCGVAYKPCGAGGGDVGLAVAADAVRMAAFRRGVLRAGLRILDLQPALQGLRVH
jgi:phosphomevalonate kinase